MVFIDATPQRQSNASPPPGPSAQASPAPLQHVAPRKPRQEDAKISGPFAGAQREGEAAARRQSSLAVAASGEPVAKKRPLAFKNGTFMYSCQGGVTPAGGDSRGAMEVLKQEAASLASLPRCEVGAGLVENGEMFEGIQLPIFDDLNEQIKECQAIETLFSPIQVEKTPMIGSKAPVNRTSQFKVDDNHF